jgi:hypothetical protein
VTRFNDKAFGAMALSTQKFLSHFMPGDVPTAADVQAALGNTNGQGSALNGSGSPLSSEESSSSQDDPLVYGPQQILDASRIDSVAQQIFGNLQLERSYLAKSYKEYPSGTDPHVDQLRAEAENVIELQQALASRYERFAGEYIDNMGVADMVSNSQTDLAIFKITLRGLLLGETASLAGAGSEQANQPYYGFDNLDELAKGGSNGQIVSALRTEEYAFSSQLFSTYNECHGTHYVINPPTAAPASPHP